MGVSGYLLVWDERSLLLTRMTQWMLGGEQSYLGKLLVGGPELTDLTLTRFLFIHIGFPFAMLFFLWMHYIRINRPVIYPPGLVTLQLFGIVFLACWGFPAISMAKANVDRMPEAMHVDWFFQWGYYIPAWLSRTLGPGAGIAPYCLWAIAITAAFVVLFALPYITQGNYVNVVKVIPERCTGCDYCAIDCHANAIRMVPTPEGIKSKGGKNRVAEILPTRCAECGICVGACPFHAIELPMYTEDHILRRLREIAGKEQAASAGAE
jgi:ferredoxin